MTFTLTVTGITACGNVTTTDQFVLTIGNKLIVNAGPDQTVPLGFTALLEGTATGGSGSYAWSWQPANLVANPNLYKTETVPLSAETMFILNVLDINSGCVGIDTVKVLMGPAIIPPVANVDYDTTVMNIPVTIPVLGNDIIQPGTLITVSFCSYPQHGVVILNADHTFTYTPAPDYTGDDVFCYMLCDNHNPPLCDTALVKIHVKPQDISDRSAKGIYGFV